MSLFYTEGYLESRTITTVAQDLEQNIFNILIVPPINNTKIITLYIYDYDIYHPIYELNIISEPIKLSGVFLERNHIYKIATNNLEVQLYYEKEVNT